MPLTLIALLGLIVLAVAIASYALVSDRQRRAVLERATGFSESALVRKPREAGIGDRLSAWLAKHMPSSLKGGGEAASKLLHAGFEGAGAVAMYGTVRI